jgi:hypothetical protein
MTKSESTKGAKKVSCLVLSIIALTVLGAVAYFMAPTILADCRQQSVIRNGVDATATIVSITDTGNRFNDNPEVVVALEVKPGKGDPWIAETRVVLTAVDLMTYKPGHTVKVRYDPGDPTTVAIVALYE